MNENIFVDQDLNINIANIKKITLGSFDIVSREFKTVSGTRMCVFYVDGLVVNGKLTIHDNIIRPCIEAKYRMNTSGIKDIKGILEDLLSAGDVKEEPSLTTCIAKLLCGDTLLFMDGQRKALIIQTRGWQTRGIQRPQTQNSVRGPQEAFTETLLFNTGLLRRKIKSENLKMEILQVGKMSKTDVCIVWVDGVADSGLVNTVRGRLKKIDVDYILESGHIEQMIEDNPRSLFSTIGNNEKPDIVAAKMMKGRVAIIVDGSPFVLTVPMLFMEGFHVAEDYYSRPFYSNLLRFLRVCSYILTLFLPAVYIALVNFHQEMIPQKLLYTIIKSKDGIPLTSFLEILLMLVLYEILREAVLRLPTPVGSTIGIVGGLIIGQAAVSAGIVGGPVVVVAAATFIASAVVNPNVDSVSILRVILLFLAWTIGIFGILLGVFGMFVHLCSLQSFGMPYMMPITPMNKKQMQDAAFRFPIKDIINKKRGRIRYRRKEK